MFTLTTHPSHSLPPSAWKTSSEDLPTVLTKPKILAVTVKWLREYEQGGDGRKRYVLSKDLYESLVEALTDEDKE